MKPRHGSRRQHRVRAVGVAGVGCAGRRRSAAAQKTELWSTRRSRPIRSRPTRTASTRRIPTSSSSGCAIRPASSPRSCSPKRRIRRPTSSSARRRRAWPCSPTKACSQPYAPKGLDKIPAQYRDSQNPPRWVGMDVYGAAICFNTVEAQKQNLPKPDDVEGPDQARLQGQDRDAESGVVGHGLPRRRRAGSRCGAKPTRGSSWTRCTRTSASTRTRARSRASRRAPASSRSASRSSTAR